MQVVEYFYIRCADDKGSAARVTEKHENWAQFYRVYVRMLIKSGRSEEEKVR